MPIGVPPFNYGDGRYPSQPAGQVHVITYGGQVM